MLADRPRLFVHRGEDVGLPGWANLRAGSHEAFEVALRFRFLRLSRQRQHDAIGLDEPDSLIEGENERQIDGVVNRVAHVGERPVIGKESHTDKERGGFLAVERVGGKGSCFRAKWYYATRVVDRAGSCGSH